MCKGHAITVLGPVRCEDLGVTLPHEHLLIDFACRYTPAPDEALVGPQPNPADRWRLVRSPAGYRVNLNGTDVDAAIAEARWFKESGGSTIADLTGIGLGPDPAGLKRIAEATGLNVIAATGLYVDPSLPDWVREATVDQLADRMVDDIARGGAEGIRRGAIGEIALEEGTELEFKCLRAGARAQARTGAPCFLHVMSGILPSFRPVTDEIIAVYKSEGGDLSRLVLCHQDGSGDDPAYQERLLKMGLWVEYDTFGSEGVFAFGEDYIQLPTDTQRIKELSVLVRMGFLEQLLISQDICYQTAKRSWGGWGFAHILDSLKPRFAAAGIDEAGLSTLMRDNPARLFAFA
jgi:phosphotriesterase-related protein